MPSEFCIYFYDTDYKFRGMIRLPGNVKNPPEAHRIAYALCEVLGNDYNYEVRTCKLDTSNEE